MLLDRKTLRRTTRLVIGAAVLLTAVAFATGGAERGIGAAVGGLVAVLNWSGMRWLGERMMTANERGRMIWGSVLALKMMAILGVVWAILSTGLVDPMGFAIGMSGFVVGILAGAFHLAWSGTSSDAATTEES